MNAPVSWVGERWRLGALALGLLGGGLFGCGDPERLDERASWLSAWDQSMTSVEEPQACPPLALPNLRVLPLQGRVTPYYAERLVLEWRVTALDEEEPTFSEWSADFPALKEGLMRLSARVVDIQADRGGLSGTHGPLPELSEPCLEGYLGQTATRDYWVDESLPGGADDPERRAIEAGDERVNLWATEVVEQVRGARLSPLFDQPSLALGPAEGDPLKVTSLGEGGSITLGFGQLIREGVGAELVIFENSFNDTFLELAWVEVSSNGVDFARLPSQYLAQQSLGPFSEQAPEQMMGLAGLTRAGWSPAFDLFSLEGHPMILTGRVNLDELRYVRVVDIKGDGRALDSGGRPIYDPFQTAESAGFDLDGVGALIRRAP